MPKPKSKVKKCQYLVAGAMFLCLIFMPNGAFAVTYDLQPYSSCEGFNCKTTLDVSTLGLSTQKINNLKGVNITNFLYKSRNISGLSYSWSGNNLTISGTITDNTYWYFDTGQDRFDPWWNFTGANTSVNFTMTKSSTNADFFGYKFKSLIAGSITILSVKNSTSQVNNCTLFSGAKALIATSTFSGDNCIVTYTLAVGDTYYIMYGRSTPPLHSYQDGMTYPVVGSMINVTAGIYDINSFPESSNTYYDALKIITWVTNSVWYENHLYLNGNQTNISLFTTTPLNSTASTNLTGAYATIWINGTLSANATNLSSNVTNLTAGLYNITAFFGNTSTNETITYWATCYNPPISIVNYSYSLCSLNDTLYVHSTQFLNGTFNYTDEYINCINGCDNVSFSCNPAQWVGDLTGFMLIVIFLVAGGLILRWSD